MQEVSGPDLTLGETAYKLVRTIRRGCRMKKGYLLVAGVSGVLSLAAISLTGTNRTTIVSTARNATGVSQTVSTTGPLDRNNAFFKSLGTNGRSCDSCHQATEGWTITPQGVRARFERTNGMDPIFRTNDGAVCPNADVSTTEARRAAYKMLLTRGLIRVSMGVPPGAEFQLVAVDDPYGCANAGDVAMFRRPLPSSNVEFLSTVMWDGRESLKGRSLQGNLMSQANDATMGHAQGAALTTEQMNSIVAFETALYTAQLRDDNVGELNDNGGKGGAKNLASQEFFVGINDPLGQNPTGAAFDPNVFSMYQEWSEEGYHDSRAKARQSVARGEKIFNTRPISIEGVAGLNDDLGVAAIPGTCTTCHDSPNLGHHSVPAPLNIGLVDESRRTPDMPLYTFRCNATGQEIKVTDPGRAMVTGHCKDLGRFKGPILRGLAARAPYFHNGSAATLDDAVEFYNTRFHLAFTEQEKKDLVAFLRTL
jgi:cytochrome c peroxidase